MANIHITDKMRDNLREMAKYNRRSMVGELHRILEIAYYNHKLMIFNIKNKDKK